MLSNARTILCILAIATTYNTSVIAYAVNQMDKAHRSMGSGPLSDAIPDVAVSFSHFHLYVDKIDDLSIYKSLEKQLNSFHASLKASTVPLSVSEQKNLWRSLLTDDGTNRGDNVPHFTPQNRDIIRQLIAGLGFRVTGYVNRSSTRSVLVSSRDPDGVQIVISAFQHTTGDDDARRVSPSSNDRCDYGMFRTFNDLHNQYGFLSLTLLLLNNREN